MQWRAQVLRGSGTRCSSAGALVNFKAVTVGNQESKPQRADSLRRGEPLLTLTTFSVRRRLFIGEDF